MKYPYLEDGIYAVRSPKGTGSAFFYILGDDFKTGSWDAADMLKLEVSYPNRDFSYPAETDRRLTSERCGFLKKLILCAMTVKDRRKLAEVLTGIIRELAKTGSEEDAAFLTSSVLKPNRETKTSISRPKTLIGLLSSTGALREAETLCRVCRQPASYKWTPEDDRISAEIEKANPVFN